MDAETAIAAGSDREALLERAREIDWYHSFELVPGVVTEGEFDLRPHVSGYGLPDDLSGVRAASGRLRLERVDPSGYNPAASRGK